MSIIIHRIRMTSNHQPTRRILLPLLDHLIKNLMRPIRQLRRINLKIHITGQSRGRRILTLNHCRRTIRGADRGVEVQDFRAEAEYGSAGGLCRGAGRRRDVMLRLRRGRIACVGGAFCQCGGCEHSAQPDSTRACNHAFHRFTCTSVMSCSTPGTLMSTVSTSSGNAAKVV